MHRIFKANKSFEGIWHKLTWIKLNYQSKTKTEGNVSLPFSFINFSPESPTPAKSE